MPFLLAKILNFQGTVHLIGVGSLSKLLKGGIHDEEIRFKKNHAEGVGTVP